MHQTETEEHSVKYLAYSLQQYQGQKRQRKIELFQMKGK